MAKRKHPEKHATPGTPVPMTAAPQAARPVQGDAQAARRRGQGQVAPRAEPSTQGAKQHDAGRNRRGKA